MKSRPAFSRVLLAIGALLAASCATSTPGSRAAQAPRLLEGLPPVHREAAMEGRVVEGMSPDAVYLAWGRPDRVARGSANGVPFELWRYTQLQPIYHAGFHGGVGYGRYGFAGYGFGGRQYYPHGLVGVDLGPDYVPVTAAVVRFSRNKVTGWERLR